MAFKLAPNTIRILTDSTVMRCVGISGGIEDDSGECNGVYVWVYVWVVCAGI